MAKFNKRRKVSRKHSADNGEISKSSVGNKVENIVKRFEKIQKLVSNNALRTSKYHKKIESNVRRL